MTKIDTNHESPWWCS